MRRLALIPATLLIGLAALAAVLAIARGYASEGSNIITRWTTARELKVPPAWSWEEAHRYLWLAHRLDPLNPDTLNELGRLYELRVSEQTAASPQGIAALAQARDYYHHSLALRPAWPFAWVNLTQLKLKQQAPDREFAWAMTQAARLGPWEWAVQVGIATAGLHAWDELPEHLRRVVETTIAHGIERESHAVIMIARDRGLMRPPFDEPMRAETSVSP